MRDETDFSKTISWTVLANMSIYFLSQSNSHFRNVSFGMILIRRGHQEHHLREIESYVVFYHFHILRVALEAVHKDPKMDAIFIILFWSGFLFFFNRLGLVLLSFLFQFGHISHKAFLEDNWLQVL